MPACRKPPLSIMLRIFFLHRHSCYRCCCRCCSLLLLWCSMLFGSTHGFRSPLCSSSWRTRGRTGGHGAEITRRPAAKKSARRGPAEGEESNGKRNRPPVVRLLRAWAARLRPEQRGQCREHRRGHPVLPRQADHRPGLRRSGGRGGRTSQQQPRRSIDSECGSEGACVGATVSSRRARD